MIRSTRLVWRHAALWIPPLLYAIVIFHFSSDSNPLPAVRALVWDKALHTMEYAGFAFLVCRALRGEGVRPWTSVALAILTASAYAASDEWHQSFVPGRDADVLDWMADTCGAGLGSTLYAALDVFIGAVP